MLSTFLRGCSQSYIKFTLITRGCCLWITVEMIYSGWSETINSYLGYFSTKCQTPAVFSFSEDYWLYILSWKSLSSRVLVGQNSQFSKYHPELWEILTFHRLNNSSMNPEKLYEKYLIMSNYLNPSVRCHNVLFSIMWELHSNIITSCSARSTRRLTSSSCSAAWASSLRTRATLSLLRTCQLFFGRMFIPLPWRVLTQTFSSQLGEQANVDWSGNSSDHCAHFIYL